MSRPWSPHKSPTGLMVYSDQSLAALNNLEEKAPELVEIAIRLLQPNALIFLYEIIEDAQRLLAECGYKEGE